MNLRFLFCTKSNLDFDSLCKVFVENTTTGRKQIKSMPLEEVYALKDYAQQRDSITVSIWTNAELQRREFILRQISLLLSISAFIISVLAYIKK